MVVSPPKAVPKSVSAGAEVCSIGFSSRVAVLVNLGTLVAWFYLVPLAVILDVPVYIAGLGDYFLLSDVGDPNTQPYSPVVQIVAYSTLIRLIAIGAILGGGFLGLFKMAPTFKNIFGDIAKAFQGEQGEEYIEGKGWYEWPLYHIPIFLGIAFIAMIVIFTIGGFPLLPSIIFAIVVAVTTFLLGAIAVRVMGETGIEPVSGTCRSIATETTPTISVGLPPPHLSYPEDEEVDAG